MHRRGASVPLAASGAESLIDRELLPAGPLREHLGDAVDDRKVLVVALLIRPGSELASLAVAGGLQTAAASPLGSLSNHRLQPVIWLLLSTAHRSICEYIY